MLLWLLLFWLLLFWLLLLPLLPRHAVGVGLRVVDPLAREDALRIDLSPNGSDL